MSRANTFFNSDGDMDISVAGNLGVLTDFANINQSTPYIKPPMQIRLTRPPKAFELFADGDKHRRWLKHLIETRCKNWNGFNPNFDIEKHQTLNGWSRQQLSTPTTTVEQQMTPSGTWDTMYDAVDVRWWRWFVRALYGDANLQRPNFGEFDTMPDDWAHDQNTFDVLVWEPNATFTKPVFAVAVANMSLSNIPEVLLTRDVSAARVGEEYNLTFDGVWSDSDRVLETAQAIMDSENERSINQRLRPVHFDQIDADVAAVDGYADGISTAQGW